MAHGHGRVYNIANKLNVFKYIKLQSNFINTPVPNIKIYVL